MPSSVVSAFQYDSSSLTLRIIFVSGKVYDYLNVPEEKYIEMKAAFSKGIYFNTNIKPYYSCKKIR